MNAFRIPQICLLALLIGSCCRDKNPHVDGCQNKAPEGLGFLSLGEAKDYLLFKPGTWWIYKNSLTGELDTMLLTSCGMSTFFASSSKRIFTYEDISFFIYSKRDSVTYQNYTHGLSAEVTDFQKVWCWERNLFGGGNVGSIIVGVVYPFENGVMGGRAPSETICKGKTSTFSVLDSTFYEVVEFDVTLDFAIPNPKSFYIQSGGNSKYYYAKGVGLVKIEHQSWDAFDKEVKFNWDLIEYHIEK